MKFKTSYSEFEVTTLVTTEPSLTLPDLTFTLQELAQKFTVNQLLLHNPQAQALFDIKSDGVNDTDFDRPSVNLPKNYDLVEAYNNAKKYSAIRLKLKKDMSDLRKRHQDKIAEIAISKANDIND